MKKTRGGLSSTLESYLELIHELQQQYGAVRVTDLAGRMGCKTPSATSALRRLAQLELINYETYRPVTLTSQGKAAIRRLSAGHRVLADLFRTVLALPEEFVEEEACSLEHRVSPPLIARLAQFMTFLNDTTAGAALRTSLQEGFARFLEAGEAPIRRRQRSS